ncbi:hypothetical protein KUW19_00125 [Ferrimonas balearica]|uniref:hypothetical protein n=1 Tax=Ferrimonas balearica TaxID=44012 RepID=UPI001C98C395|nr:hypothetical protein [Ferrimonas balearica]MBY6104887.1 hypothetical protein [Ferrimonas balearica]
MSNVRDKAHEDFLHRQLIKLGDMIGDGLADEPDGKWIRKEYRKVAEALGVIPKRKRATNAEAINERMVERCRDVPCSKCGGPLKQTRSGSCRAVCQCGAKYQLMKIVKRRRSA